MDKNKELYDKLRKQYTDEELVESFVFPPDITPKKRRRPIGKWLNSGSSD